MPDGHHIEMLMGGRPVAFDLNHHPSWEGCSMYEGDVVNVMSHFVKAGDLVVDAGASLGFFTLIASRLVGDDGLVIAFDADPRSFNNLCENLKLNRTNNVAAYEYALGSYDGEALFWVAEPDGCSSLFKLVGATPRSVEIRKLDTLLSDPNNHPQFLKIDCEGAEWQVLRGAERILAGGVDCVVLEFNYYIMEHFNISPREIRDYMHALGYDMFLISIGDPTGREMFSKPHLVDPAKDLVVDAPTRDIRHLNVMFSTSEKVDALWG